MRTRSAEAKDTVNWWRKAAEVATVGAHDWNPRRAGGGVEGLGGAAEAKDTVTNWTEAAKVAQVCIGTDWQDLLLCAHTIGKALHRYTQHLSLTTHAMPEEEWKDWSWAGVDNGCSAIRHKAVDHRGNCRTGKCAAAIP
jgi:hypothetical protein